MGDSMKGWFKVAAMGLPLIAAALFGPFGSFGPMLSNIIKGVSKSVGPMFTTNTTVQPAFQDTIISTGTSTTIGPRRGAGMMHGGPHHPVIGTPVRVNPLTIDQNTTTLTDEEKESLIEMVQEEKLARDVYRYLYQVWHVPVFYNISLSEETHVSMVRNLLQRYGIEDPTLNLEDGQFADEKFNELYRELTEQGSQGITEALKVGAMIEELDIKDLRNWLEEINATDIRAVYCNLMKGSRNHLRAFVRTLETYGGVYTPTYLEDAEEIIANPFERGYVGC